MAVDPKYEKLYNAKFPDRMHRIKEREKKDYEQTYQAKLPSYFHNVNARIALGQTQEKSLRVIENVNADVKSHFTMFGAHNTIKINDQRAAKKKSKSNPLINLLLMIETTFNQLLHKYGYLEEEQNDKPRVRPWHAAQANAGDYSSSDDDFIA